VAAVKPDNTAFAIEPVMISPDPARNDQPVTLTLRGSKTAPETAIDVCLKSEDGAAVPLSNSEPARQQIKIKQLDQPGCIQAIAGAASQYKLNLLAKTNHPETELHPTFTMVNGAALLILGLALASVVLGSISVFKFRALRRETATTDSVKALAKTVSEVLGKTGELHKLIGMVPAQVKELLPVIPGPPAATEPNQLPKPPTKPNQPSGPRGHDVHNLREDAKRKYSELRQGASIEHFFLMPSGASSASDMVHDARLELREQSHGTYIAFRSGADDTQAWVFPKPGVYFTPEMFNAVFPALTAAEYERGSIEPRLAVEQAPLVWKI
jgi:hypothetical protein